MSKLEDLRPNASVRGILPDCLVRVASVQWFGSEALELTYKDPAGIADEVIAHLAGLVGSNVTVILEIEAEIDSGTPENVVRTVTENCRTLKFTDHGFEKE